MAIVSIKNSTLSNPARDFSFQNVTGAAPVVPVPTFTSATTSSYTVAITGYDAQFTYTVSASAGSAVRTGGNVTVSGLSANQSSTLTVTAANPDGTKGLSLSSAVAFLSLPATPTLTVGGITGTSFTVTIGNYNAGLTYTISATAGSATRSAGVITVSGLTGGQSSTVSVTASNASGNSATAQITGTAVAPPATPTLAASTGTTSSRQVTITNYNAALTYNVSTTAGSASRSGNTVTVSGLAFEQSFTLTVSATNAGGTTNGQIISSTLVLGSWTSATFTNDNQDFCAHLIHKNGIFIGSGRSNIENKSKIYRSTDAITWTAPTLSTTWSQSGGILRYADFDGTRWISIAQYGLLESTNNGVSWTSMGFSMGQVNPNFGVLRGMAYGNGRWVAVGSGSTYPSETGGTINTATSAAPYTWTTVASGATKQFYDVAYGNGIWLAVGGSGQIARSTDGISWSTSGITSNFGTSTIRKAAYGNGAWVIGGYYGLLRTSTNGITWTTVTSNLTNSISTISYGNGLWLVASYSPSAQVRISTNATTWVTESVTIAVDPITSAYGGDRWIIAESSLAVLRRANFS